MLYDKLQLYFYIINISVILLCFFSAILLIYSRPLRNARNPRYRIACKIIACATIFVAAEHFRSLLVGINQGIEMSYSFFGTIFIASTQSLMFTYLLILLFTNKKISKKNILPHLIPTLICTVIYFLARFTGYDSEPGSIRMLKINPYHPASLAGLFFALVYFIHLGFYTYIFLKERREHMIRIARLENSENMKLEMSWVTNAFFVSLLIGILAFTLIFDISYFYALTVNVIFAIFYVGFGLTYSNYHYTYDKIYHEVIITDSDIKVDSGIDDLVNNLVCKREKELFKKVEEYMSSKPYLDPMFSQTVMIKDLFTNERYLSNAIQNSCGMTVKKYIDRYRIENACKELVDSNEMKKIEDIALASGFSNDRTFFRLFKEAKGMTPSAYRKESLIIKEIEDSVG